MPETIITIADLPLIDCGEGFYRSPEGAEPRYTIGHEQCGHNVLWTGRIKGVQMFGLTLEKCAASCKEVRDAIERAKHE